MIYRKLGSTGIDVSVIGLGTHQFGGDWDKSFSQKEVYSITNKAREMGINLIDTAACYGSNHLSERLIGKAISNQRSKWVIATKFGQRYDNNTKTEIPDFRVKQVKKQLASSMKALRVDNIDLYQFHSGTNSDFDNEDLWSFLHSQIDQGKIGKLGISFVHKLVNQGDIFQLDNVKKVGADFVQLVYNRLTKDAEKIFLPYCKREGIGVLSRVPLAKGFLSGKYSPGHRFSSSDHRSKFSQEMNNNLLKRVENIKKREIPLGVSPSQWALSWCLKNPTVASVIPGCKNTRQVVDNAEAINLIIEDNGGS